MTYLRRAYDDASSPAEMTADCHAVEAALRLPSLPPVSTRTSRAVVRPAPSLLFDDYPRDVRKPEITVSAAAARLAAAMHLHLH